MRKRVHFFAFSLALLGAIGCGRRSTRLLPTAEREETSAIVERFVAHRLQAANVAPPTLTSRVAWASVDGLSGRAELILPEDEDWNQWPDSSARLFNNRAAHLFRIEVAADGPLRWMPRSTQLELNEVGNVFRAAPSQEALLEELLFWAYHQERQVLTGDLVERTRAAGAFRASYLPMSSDGPTLAGVVAFPLVVTDENSAHYETIDPPDLHVVSMRLSMLVTDADGPHELVWLFE